MVAKQVVDFTTIRNKVGHMSYSTLNYEQDNGIGVLTIQRPEALNALNAEVLKDLKSLLSELKTKKDLRCLIVTGAGNKAFVAGADIKEMQARPEEEGQKMAEEGQSAFKGFEELHCVVIAAVNGFALGGGLELALSCDFIIASDKAKLGLPEVSLGLIPGFGGTQRLSRNVGKGVARRMVLTGDMFTAQQCANWGLVTEVVPSEELMALAKKIAAKVISQSPNAIRLAKRAVNEGYDQTLYEGLNLEAKLFQQAFSSEDKKIGTAAFVEKKPPQFVGE